MIQRIQSVYLILAACAMALCYMFPVATYKVTLPALDGSQQEVTFKYGIVPSKTAQVENEVEMMMPLNAMAKEGYRKAPWWPMAGVCGAVIVLSLVALFMYKNRMKQVRVVAVGVLLSVVYVFMAFVWIVDAFRKGMNGVIGNQVGVEWVTTYNVGTWAPIAAVVLLFLAQNAIKRDEKKVRAADRLR